SDQFTTYQLPTLLSGACDVTDGPDGAEWNQELFANQLARIDPHTGEVTEYLIPFTAPLLDNVTIPMIPGVTGKIPLGCGLVTGTDGHLYAVNGLRNQIVRMNVSTKHMDVFSAPNILGNLEPLNDLTPYKDAIFFTQTSGNQIGRFDYATQEFTNYDVPTPLALPLGIFAASDGGIWFLEAGANKVGRLDPETGDIIEIPVGGDLGAPFTTRAETEGRYVWFAALTGNSLGRIDIFTHEIKAFPVGAGSFPVELCADNGNNIWFTHLLKNQISRLDPSTGEVLDVDLPDPLLGGTPLTVIPDIAPGIFCEPGNNVWTAEATRNIVVKYAL
ncbi:NHL repeat-containing protein, partial [Saccharata proteae CBS 121410]